MNVESVGNSTELRAGDELELVFEDDDKGVLDFFQDTPEEFAADLLDMLFERGAIDFGDTGLELFVLPVSAQGFSRMDGQEEIIGAVVIARVVDLRPQAEQEQQASLGHGVKLFAALALAGFGIWAIKPVLVEVRRTLRGFTDTERAEPQPGPSIGTVVLGVAAVVLAIFVLSRSKQA